MEDLLGLQGKVAGMEGIESKIAFVILRKSDGTSISNGLVGGLAVSPDYFSVLSSGQLYNNGAIDFNIGAEDVTETATFVTIEDSSLEVLLRIDLEATVLLTTEGTATFAIGDLTAVLE
jgi:hypothetical protein